MVDSVACLHAANVVHFDLKLQNVYIELVSGVSGEDSFQIPPCYPPVHVVVGDFGESKIFSANSSGFTMRPLGTDLMKSPEMLRNGQHRMLHQRRENFDRRRHKGAGAPSDIWSLGCLLYELVFGDMLFGDDDYMRFLQRLCFNTGPVLPPTAVSKLKCTPTVYSLVTLMTERNHEARIDIFKLQSKMASIATHHSALLKRTIAKGRPPYSFPPTDAQLHELEGVQPQSACSLTKSLHPPGRSEDVCISHITSGILIGLHISCIDVSLLASTGVECILVLPTATNVKSCLLQCRSLLSVPCVFFSSGLVSGAVIFHVCERIWGLNRVLLVCSDSEWSLASTLAASVAVHKNQFDCSSAMLLLRKRWVHARFCIEHVKLLQEVCRLCESDSMKEV